MEGKIKSEVTDENKEEVQARVKIWRSLVCGFAEMAVVKCAIELEIPDILEKHGKPMTLSELSTTLVCSPPALFRIMRFLVHQGIFGEETTTQGSLGYVQTVTSRLLMRHGDHSMAPLVLLESSPVMMESWYHLTASVLDNGPPPFVGAHGKDVWEYAATDPGQLNLFNAAMACDVKMSVAATLDECPEVFQGLSSLVDVGGGNGSTLRAVLETLPLINGINFDLSHVVSVAPECEGIEHVGGDMFKSVPKANAALLKWILHDWGDDECIQILKNCREAIPEETGKLIIVDSIIEEKDDDKLKDIRLMLDMLLMAQFKGKERTAEEWAYILREAGFTRHTVKHIQAIQSVIEAYP